MIIVEAAYEKRINLGKYGDSSATCVRFDVHEILDRFGSGGSFTLINQRFGDSTGYPVNMISADGDALFWTVTSSDLKAGIGMCQLIYSRDGIILHTEIWDTFCGVSLSAGGTVPDPWIPWVEELTALKNQAVGAVAHYPYVDQQTNHWMLWNVQCGAFIDTGINATGPMGDKGVGIVSVTKTATVGKVDTYTITFDDGSTEAYTVTNGVSPNIGNNGNWWIDGYDTGIHAKGDKGDTGDVQFATFYVNPDTGQLSVTYTKSGEYTFDISDGKLMVII